MNKRQKEDQNLWNFLASILFLIVLVLAVWEVWGEHGGNFPHSVPVFDAILMALAAFRVTRLIVYDKIARWFRELFADTEEIVEDGVTYVHIKPYGSGLRHTIWDLLQCPWCIGFWSALVIAFCYFIFPWAWFVIFFLALAGAGSLVQITANSIGWRAENLKMEAHERQRDLML